MDTATLDKASDLNTRIRLLEGAIEHIRSEKGAPVMLPNVMHGAGHPLFGKSTRVKLSDETHEAVKRTLLFDLEHQLAEANKQFAAL